MKMRENNFVILDVQLKQSGPFWLLSAPWVKKNSCIGKKSKQQQQEQNMVEKLFSFFVL